VSVVEVLARLGADVNNPSTDGCTPIYIAAEMGHVSTVQTLLRLGADATKAYQGWTPMDIAASKGHTAVVQVFKEAGLRSARYPDA
jgi:ankyrin repeat protein